MTTDYQSWGRYPPATQRVEQVLWRSGYKLPSARPLLPYGQGRSYGDACLNDGGTILSTRHLNRLLGFDGQNGIVRCESGMTLGALLEFSVPRGWFIPVSPGTKFVSIGGAIANDIHGKNHHSAGTFGRHVLDLELMRSDGTTVTCSPTEHTELFNATIAGLGLTGLILSATIQMKRIESGSIEMESVKFRNLDEFFDISRGSDAGFEYTVAWLDCVSSGASFGRGIFMRGNHATREKALRRKGFRAPLSVPIDFPSFALNRVSIKAFNELYYRKQRKLRVSKIVDYDPFFYPLDSVRSWNRIYGKRGFLQFQCVVPSTGDNKPVKELLRLVVASGSASFLAVMKEFGSIASPGLMSFPRSGVTLCLDFPFRGARTLELFERMDSLVRVAGGALYPAKDACMSPASFAQYYPAWKTFTRFIDPAFSSSFWRRVTRNLT